MWFVPDEVELPQQRQIAEQIIMLCGDGGLDSILIKVNCQRQRFVSKFVLFKELLRKHPKQSIKIRGLFFFI